MLPQDYLETSPRHSADISGQKRFNKGSARLASLAVNSKEVPLNACNPILSVRHVLLSVGLNAVVSLYLYLSYSTFQKKSGTVGYLKAVPKVNVQ